MNIVSTVQVCSRQVKSNYSDVIITVAQDIISRPGPGRGRNSAKFLYPASYPAPAGYEAGSEVGFDHLSMRLPHCVIGQEFIVLQIR